MRLVLHIGTPKTGTSTLQRVFDSNRRRLGRHGVIYPKPGFGRRNHNLLTAVLHGPDDMPREFRAGGRSADELAAMSETCWESIGQQLARSKASTAIISGEYFFNLDEPKLTRLYERVTPLADEIDVVCYVREPAAYYVSRMQQRVKGTAKVAPPGRFRTHIAAALTRHLDLAPGRVVARPFDRSALVDGDIVADFLTTFVPDGAPLVGHLAGVRANESMSAEAMCILQTLQRRGWPETDNRFKPETTNVIETLAAQLSDIPQTPARLRPELEAALIRNLRDDLVFLDERFGIRFDDIAAPANESDATPPGWMSGELRDVLDVDADAVERTLYMLLKELAAR